MLLSSGQAQRLLACSRPTLARLIRRGQLTPLIDARGHRWFADEEVARLALARVPRPAQAWGIPPQGRPFGRKAPSDATPERPAES